MTSKAIDIRREILKEGVNLTPVEKRAFVASTRTQVKDLDNKKLTDEFAVLFKGIASDIGLKIKSEDGKDIIYDLTSITKYLKNYYSHITLADIKVAFEYLIVGELDKFLPKDAYGNADRKCYNNFNAEFFTKVINAYEKRQREIFAKAYENTTPQEKSAENERNAQIIENEFNASLKRYKETGELKFMAGGSLMVYGLLKERGLIEGIEVTDDDRQRAYTDFLKSLANGMINKYKAQHVKKEGAASSELDYPAEELARLREIKKAFDKL